MVDFVTRLFRFARWLASSEDLDSSVQVEAAAVEQRDGFFRRVFESEELPSEAAQGVDAASRGLLRGLFASEELPLDPPVEAAGLDGETGSERDTAPGWSVGWLFKHERLGDEARDDSTDRGGPAR